MRDFFGNLAVSKTYIMKYSAFYVAMASLFIGFVSCDDDKKPDIPITPDAFGGEHSLLTMTDETASLTPADIELIIQTPDGTEISRRATHRRSAGQSTIRMDVGLKEGEYRLLAARYANPDAAETQEFPTVEYGLGSRISVSASGIKVADPFDARVGYAGKGTKDAPYIVSSSSHLLTLMMTVNDYDSWQELPAGTYFKQVRDIDMKQASRSCDMEYGWLPIGADTNTPFRGIYLGDGHRISNLQIDRPTSAGVGLFGYILDATVDGLTVSGSTVAGQFAVGCIAGASVTSSQSRGVSTITNCIADGCVVKGDDTSAAVGSLLGAADMYTKTLIANCRAENGKVAGGMNVGGIMGCSGMFSSTVIENCENRSAIESQYSGAGGIVGTADTLQVLGCRNYADIAGSRRGAEGKYPGVGTGGIAGGAGMSWITASTNSGAVAGLEGVGGIVGSTRVCGSAKEGYQYNQSVLRYCSNGGAVSGQRFVGGAIGEAQAGGYGVCNTAPVSATEYAGGICGTSSVAVIHNSVNTGNVEADRYVAGIVGKTTWGSLALDQNYGEVSGKTGVTGGVVGLAGNNTIMNYCANYGKVSVPSGHAVGGIVGETGDPRKWTAMNIAECVVGSLECVMAVAGPVLAVAEHAIEFAHGVEIALKILEFGAESCLQIADYTLLGFGMDALINPEMEAELEADIKAEVQSACTETADQLRNIRATAGGTVMNFDLQKFHTHYTPNIAASQAWYEQDGNDERFNRRMNETREERGEANEKVAKAHEIFHTAVAGVAILTSTVALVGGTIASGGTATAFMVAGSVAAIVGGVNAIVKTCTEFENNAVVISQCVNAGEISSHGSGVAGVIAGKVNDGCQVTDNLNTGSYDFSYEYIVCGAKGSHCDIRRNVSTWTRNSYADPGFQHVGGVTLLLCDPLCKSSYYALDENLYVTPQNMRNRKYYRQIGIKDDAAEWTLPESAEFMIPAESVMCCGNEK